MEKTTLNKSSGCTFCGTKACIHLGSKTMFPECGGILFTPIQEESPIIVVGPSREDTLRQCAEENRHLKNKLSELQRTLDAVMYHGIEKWFDDPEEVAKTMKPPAMAMRARSIALQAIEHYQNKYGHLVAKVQRALNERPTNENGSFVNWAPLELAVAEYRKEELGVE